MKRRTVLLGSAGLVGAAAGAALLWRPEDRGGPHDAYFSALNDLLRRQGPGRPVMVLDLDRVHHNTDLLATSVGPEKTYRVVVKSLPSVDLLDAVMQRAATRALMVFHQPFLNAVAERFPDSDVLIGKPMPVAAVRTFYRKLSGGAFNPAQQLQWLVDTHDRLLQYRELARELGVAMRVSVELDLGLHRGGLPEAAALDAVLATIASDPAHLSLAGFMGYEPHLTGLQADLDHPAVRNVLSIYQGFIDRARQRDVAIDGLTLNGAGSHTLGIYPKDRTMNDLSAGSGVVMPTDFDTYHLSEHQPALFIAAPILKHYDSFKVPGDTFAAKMMSWWNPNDRQMYYIYGGYWKAKVVSPPGTGDSIYQSTNQTPIGASSQVDLKVDDYLFLRPTQSEHVMLQFGDLLVMKDQQIVDQWPVFQQTG